MGCVSVGIKKIVDKLIMLHLKQVNEDKIKHKLNRITPLCPKCLEKGLYPKVKRSKMEYENWICKKCNYIIRKK